MPRYWIFFLSICDLRTKVMWHANNISNKLKEKFDIVYIYNLFNECLYFIHNQPIFDHEKFWFSMI